MKAFLWFRVPPNNYIYYLSSFFFIKIIFLFCYIFLQFLNQFSLASTFFRATHGSYCSLKKKREKGSCHVRSWGKWGAATQDKNKKGGAHSEEGERKDQIWRGKEGRVWWAVKARRNWKWGNIGGAEKSHFNLLFSFLQLFTFLHFFMASTHSLLFDALLFLMSN